MKGKCDPPNVRPAQELIDQTTLWPPPRFTQSDLAPLLGLTVSWHPDPRRVGESVEWVLERGRGLALSRTTPDFAQPGEQVGRPLADGFLSRIPIRFTTLASGGVRISLEGPKILLEVNGAVVLSQRELEPEEVDVGVVLLLNERVLLVLHWRGQVARRPPHFGMVGESSGMVRVRQQIEKLAGKSNTVLIQGENGTGKELIARALHHWGARKDRVFLAVNVASIPPTLAASEFFGTRQGAYTGAGQTPGYFRDADHGTLFLDEIGDVPPPVQVSLLRALESGEVQPVGATKPLSVDVRVIGATDCDLEEAVAKGDFRQPLYFRLAERVIELPPLRQRKEDIGRLLYHFLGEELSADETWRLYSDVESQQWWIPACVVARFLLSSWPGNVRQLKHVVSTMVEESLGLPIVVLPHALRGSPEIDHVMHKTRKDPESMACADFRRLLRGHSWKVRPVAHHLGVSADTVYRRMKACGLRKAGELTAEEIETALEESQGDLAAAAEELQVSLYGFKQRMNRLGLR